MPESGPGSSSPAHAAEALPAEARPLQQGWAAFDARQRLVGHNSRYRELLFPELLFPELRGELIGRSRAQLLELWLPRARFASEAERERFQGSGQARRAEQVRCEVWGPAGAPLRVVEQAGVDGTLLMTVGELDGVASERAELRRALEQAHAAGVAKSELLWSLSHELRTPLNSMLGFAQLLERDRREGLGQRQRARVLQILQGGDHLVKMIDDLLDLSRIEAGRVGVTLQSVDVLALLGQLLASLEPLATPRGVSLSRDAGSQGAALLRVHADPARLLQILTNFGANAIKYNRAGGSVTFRASQPREGRLRVSVVDTGLGVPEAQQARLFEPFQRAGQERGTIQGTGMGLAISKRLAGLMDGSVGFTSVWQVGSEFWVELPSARG